MNYYAIEFPFHITLIVKAKCSAYDLIHSLHDFVAIRAPSGAMYNSRQFISVTQIFEPDARQKRTAQDFAEALSLR